MQGTTGLHTTGERVGAYQAHGGWGVGDVRCAGGANGGCQTGLCLVILAAGGGGGKYPPPGLTPPPTHIRKMCFRTKMRGWWGVVWVGGGGHPPKWCEL